MIARFFAILVRALYGCTMVNYAGAIAILTNLKPGLTVFCLKKPCFTRWIGALPARPNGLVRVFQPDANAIKDGFVNWQACAKNEPKTGGNSQRAMRMETGPADGGGKMVLEAIDLCASVPITQPNPTKADIEQKPEKRRALLQHFNLLVRRSDRIGIVGPNGVGKSTLVRLLLGTKSRIAGAYAMDLA